MKRHAALIALLCAAATATPAPAQQTQPTIWLCRPGLANSPCDTDLTATRIDGSNESVVGTKRPSGPLPVDCFYVYPTVSAETTDNADLTIGPEERSAAAEQASRFSTVCNVWAPMYRQITGTAIAAGRFGEKQLQITAYESVLSAWRDYLANDNNGRPFVLIGHSQGAIMLTYLLQSQIDNNDALRARMISAVLLGGDIIAPTGKDVGGSFKHIPACRAQAQTGCVIAYSTFDTQPPSDSYFGMAREPGMSVICTNPAALSGGSAPLDTFLPKAAAKGATGITTPWIEYPDLYVGACMHQDDAVWLQATRTAATRRTPPFIGASSPQWGMHDFDIDLSLGNLVEDIAHAESSSASAGSKP